jgi:hypothetical protein
MNFHLVLPAFLALSPLSLANQVTIVPAMDNTIYSEDGTLSNGAGSFLFCGQNSMGDLRRALLRFDVSSGVPAGSTITSVQLVLHLSQTVSGAVPVTVHRVLAGWGEGASHAPGAEGSGGPAMVNDATWTERFFGVALPWSAPGGDFAAAVSTSQSVAGVGTYTFPSTAALVADAQSMLDVPMNDVGWIVIGDETAFGSAKRFDSRQNTTPGVQPRLIVDFTPPCTSPVTNYCTAAPNSAGPGAQISWSGNQSIAFNSFALNASGLPANPTGIFYFGPTQTSVPFGNGVRCVSGFRRRLGTLTTVGSTIVQQLDFTTAPANVITAGSTWNFQFWYRDPAAGGAGFNLTNGLSATFCP